MENRLDHVIEIVCPHCRNPHQRSVRWFFSNRNCPRCTQDMGPSIESVLLDLRDACQQFLEKPPPQ